MCPVCKARVVGVPANEIVLGGRGLCDGHKAIIEILALPRANHIVHNVKIFDIGMLKLDLFDSASFDGACSMRDLSRWLKAFGAVNVPKGMYARCQELAWRMTQDRAREFILHAVKISS